MSETTPYLRLEYRGRPQRWCVVHDGTGLAVLVAIRSEKEAQMARARVLAMPIAWGSIEVKDFPPLSLGGGIVSERGRSVRIADAESRRLLLDEQVRVAR